MIEIQELDFRYGKKLLFQNLQISLEKGRLYGFLGLNGAGKSTLFKLLCGLLYPEKGQIRVLGEESPKRSPELLSRLFLLPEESSVPSISGEEYLYTRASFYPNFDREIFNRYCKELELPTLKQKLHRLSYGQKKKFLLAFGLASGAQLILLDEPTNGLDIPSKAILRRLLVEALTPERSFIISTHQVSDISTLVDSIIIVHQGRILFDQSLQDIEKYLHMQCSETAPDTTASGLLYNELTARGYWSVWQGPAESYSPLDLEILFNTVLHYQDKPSKLSFINDSVNNISHNISVPDHSIAPEEAEKAPENQRDAKR